MCKLADFSREFALIGPQIPCEKRYESLLFADYSVFNHAQFDRGLWIPPVH